MRLALFEPDIPQNAGTILRMAACLGVGVDIIEPCGFLLDDRRLRRAGMDYLARGDMMRHPSWRAYWESRAVETGRGRIILLTTQAECCHDEFAYQPGDTLLLGRESAGVPDQVHAAADGRVRIPMVGGMRSLNVAVAAAMVLGEALRQTGQFPKPGTG